MATIVVRRPGEWIGRLRRVGVHVDGVRRAGVRSPGEERIEVPAGEHEVIARIDWVRSDTLRLRLAEADTVVLRLHHSWPPFYRLVLGLLNLHLTVEQASDGASVEHLRGSADDRPPSPDDPARW